MTTLIYKFKYENLFQKIMAVICCFGMILCIMGMVGCDETSPNTNGGNVETVQKSNGDIKVQGFFPTDLIIISSGQDSFRIYKDVNGYLYYMSCGQSADVPVPVMTDNAHMTKDLEAFKKKLGVK